MKIIPAIDLIEGKTVRLEQGKYDKKLSYDLGPLEAAKKWVSFGARLIHVVDLDGAKEGRPVNLDVASKISEEVNVPIELGGGFRTTEDIDKALEKGIWRVILGSKILEDMDFAKKVIEAYGERVILSLDVEGKKPKVRGWKEEVDMDVFEVIKKFMSFGVSEIIYTDITRDGTLTGPNTQALEEVLDKTGVRIISAGGIKSVDHVKELLTLEKKGLTGIIIGRALYDGTIDLGEAINAC